MPEPWRGWYHAVATTYGTWLRGDPRGWRSWQHHEHVEGDYKSPPPTGKCRLEFEQSRRTMKHKPIVLYPSARVIVCESLVERLLDSEVIAVAVASTHAHVVCRFVNWSGGKRKFNIGIYGLNDGNSLQDGRDPVPRHVMGVAMKHASHEARKKNAKRPGPLWARRAKFVPIENREHQVAAVHYLKRHHKCEGAALWTMWKQRIIRPDEDYDDVDAGS